MKDTRSQSLNPKSDGAGSYGGHSTIRTIDSNFSSNDLDMMLNCMDGKSSGHRSVPTKGSMVSRKLQE